MINWGQEITRNDKFQYLFQKYFQLFSNKDSTSTFSLLTKCV